MKNFVEKRVNSKTESFWDPVPNLKVKDVKRLQMTRLSL